MSNPSKAKGTAAESAVVKLAQSFGLAAERRALAGAADQGDVWIDGGVLVVKRPGSGAARAGDWFAWITVSDLNFIAAPKGNHVTATYCPDQRVMLPLGDLLAIYAGGRQ